MGNPLSRVGKRFQMEFKKIDGTPFMGQMLDIPDTSRVSNFLSTRRYLRTMPVTIVIPSDVIIVDGVKFIVAEHGTGFYKEPIYKHFKCFEVSSIEQWYKIGSSQNTLTGQKELVRTLQVEPLYVSIQPKGTIEDMIHVQQQTYTAIINRIVSRDDQIGNKIVTKVDKVLGVYLVEMKDK